MQEQNSIPHIEEDNIDLRELFTIIGRYKWSIIFFTIFITFGVAVKVYFMPKYYKSTVMIEVKPQDNKSGGFSLEGAAAMLLGGGGGSINLEKDITLLKTYRTNQKVLDKVNSYMVRYFITDEKHKEVEVENNLSIEVTDVKIKNFRNYGKRLIIEPLSKTKYQLIEPGKLFNNSLGVYHYSEMVTHEEFSLMVYKKREFNTQYTIELAGNKHYVYDNIITKNLNIEASKKSPFLTISFLDNLPSRGEAYLKNLIEVYTKQSIDDIKSDALVIMDSYDRQLKKVEQRVATSSKRLENFKSSQGIISPKVQATALVSELSNVGIEIAKNNYKVELLSNLIKFTKKHNNIDAIAPSLIELQDKPTIELIKLIQEQQLAISELLLKYKPNHPTIQRANKTIYNLKSKVISNLKNLQKTLKSKTLSLKNMEKSYNKNLKASPKQEQKLISFSRDYKVSEKMYLYLLQQRSSAELKHDKALSHFRIIEDIYTANKATKPKKALIVIVAFISSLILMVFVAFFREFLRKGKENE